MSERTFVRHVVFFSASDPENLPTIVKGLWRLAEIPGSRVFEVVSNKRVDQFSGEVDVVVYAEFDDDAALAAYKAHPIYQETIAVVRPLRDLRIAADF